MIKGMSDDQLELACEDKSSGIAPRVYWTSELYSFGKCFRYCANYPEVLPLFIYSDHGTNLTSHLATHELENTANVHFTWNPVKEQRNRTIVDREVMQIMHPWIFYRRQKNLERSKKAKGTIVFFAHSTAAVKWQGHDSGEYIEQLKALPEKFQPVVLCLHMHDIKSGFYKEVRRHGLPIVTVGNTSSIDFVDRFYDLIREFHYATSQVWGSQVAYCVELGMPYFFLGERPELINFSDKNLPVGLVHKYSDAYHKQSSVEAHRLFDKPTDSVTEDQRKFVESLLGIASGVSPRRVSFILWREFFRHWRQWPTMFRPIAAHLLSKLGLLELVKKCSNRLDNHKSEIR